MDCLLVYLLPCLVSPFVSCCPVCNSCMNCVLPDDEKGYDNAAYKFHDARDQDDQEEQDYCRGHCRRSHVYHNEHNDDEDDYPRKRHHGHHHARHHGLHRNYIVYQSKTKTHVDGEHKIKYHHANITKLEAKGIDHVKRIPNSSFTVLPKEHDGNDTKAEHANSDAKAQHCANDAKAKYIANDTKVENVVNNVNEDYVTNDTKTELDANDIKVDHLVTETKEEYVTNYIEIEHGANDIMLEHVVTDTEHVAYETKLDHVANCTKADTVNFVEVT